MPLKLIKGELWHLRYIIDNVRPEQRCGALTVISANLEQAVMLSYACKTAFDGTEPLVMWGVVADTFMSELGLVWLIGTEKIEAHRMEFLRRSRKEVHLVMETFPRLRCVVDGEFNKSLNWLKWLNFREVERADNIIVMEKS